ncbi:MAG TPA: co-chaperone GroES [Candidatus Nitrosotenuis sp.]|jgi:chaperonin GroES|nr:co-chaperone GroES [Candidatus Nitrosotenuis sp.]
MATATVTKVRPLGERVLIKPLPQEEKTAGGVILPDTAKEKPMKGEVVAAGPGKINDKGERTPMELKVGDKVLFGKYAGTEIKIDGEDYVIMEQREVLGVFEG